MPGSAAIANRWPGMDDERHDQIAPPEFFLRRHLGDGEMTGPGKAAPLEGIARTISISAAGREMATSCKRAYSNRRSGQIT